MKESYLERELARQIALHGLPEPEREARFHPDRLWRFDFAWSLHKIAAETEGGTWANGRHSRGSGLEGDLEKYNEAALRGWKVLRFNDHMLNDGRALTTLIRAFSESTVDL